MKTSAIVRVLVAAPALAMSLLVPLAGCEKPRDPGPAPTERVTETASPRIDAGPAEPLPVPTGPILLTISGAITNTNVDGTAQFDREMLLELGMHRLRTTTFWTEGVQEFEGFLASDLMDRVGANGTTISATALNDYEVEIPVADFERYGVVFALRMNGETLTRRDKGPIWPVYPRDDFPELQNRAADKKWIYMLHTMDIRE